MSLSSTRIDWDDWKQLYIPCQSCTIHQAPNLNIRRPTKTLRTSLPGAIGLGPHTPSTCAGMPNPSYQYQWCVTWFHADLATDNASCKGEPMTYIWLMVAEDLQLWHALWGMYTTMTQGDYVIYLHGRSGTNCAQGERKGVHLTRGWWGSEAVSVLAGVRDQQHAAHAPSNAPGFAVRRLLHRLPHATLPA